MRLYATGTIGDLFGVSVFVACTVIHKVSRAIVKRLGHFLSFPDNLTDTKRKFYDAAHFLGVIRAIDCTHIRILHVASKEGVMAFINKKQFYSINVQAVCDNDAFSTNIVARWPGSTRTILRTAASQKH